MAKQPTRRKDSLPGTPAATPQATPEADELEARLQALDEAQYAIERAFTTGKADRAEITRKARDSALKAADLVAIAMEADAEADELGRMAIITENSKDRDKIKTARRRARDARKESKRAHEAATDVAKDAYDAVKFSTPGKLGFMRFVQVVFALNIAFTLFTLLGTSRDVVVYDTFTIMNWIRIILQGVAFWFFINFYKVARPFVMGMAAFSIVVPVIVDLVEGDFNLWYTLFDSAWNIFLLVYFWRSKRVKATLVNDFSSLKPTAVGADFKINRKGWPFYRNLIMYFIVFSVLGHWMEAAMCQLIRLGIVEGEYDPTNTMLWRDWLYPFPMEGAAVVIIAVALYPLWQKLLKMWPDKPWLGYGLSFVANGLTCGIIEFSMGLIVNADYQLWDYREMPFNLMGQVCLQNMAAFAAAASLICWIVYPMIERWIARTPRDTMNIIFVVIAIFGGILWSLYIVDPPENHKYDPIDLPGQGQLGTDNVGDVMSEIDNGAFIFEIGTTSLQTELDRDTTIDDAARARIQQQIDQINAAVDELNAIQMQASGEMPSDEAPAETAATPEAAADVPESTEVAPEETEVAPEAVDVTPEDTEVAPEAADVVPEATEDVEAAPTEELPEAA